MTTLSRLARPAPKARLTPQLAVLSAARKLGSNPRGEFSLWDIEGLIGTPALAIAAIVGHLERAGCWPYVRAGSGVYRDPRPWYERIARAIPAADIEDAR